MTAIAQTPEPPYYAVIFTSLRSAGDHGYAAMALRMEQLAAASPGFLGMESAREETGLTVCYWSDLDSIRNWKRQVEHQEAQRRGRETWYTAWRVRIARVERDYGTE